MFRTLLCAAVALVLFAGVGRVEEKKAKKGAATVVGTFKKMAGDVLTLAIKGKKGTEKEIKVPEDVKVTVFAGDEKKELSGKDGLKEIKEGTAITVLQDADGKVIGVRVGAPAKKPGEKPAGKKGSTLNGTIKKIDGGTLTLAIKGKTGNPDTEKDVKLPDDVKVTVWTGAEKKDFAGTVGLKEIKEGTAVTVALDGDGKVTGVVVGKQTKKPK